jgi:hypothetical protein
MLPFFQIFSRLLFCFAFLLSGDFIIVSAVISRVSPVTGLVRAAAKRNSEEIS